MDKTSKQIVSAIGMTVVYAWIASLVWHYLPTEGWPWWVFPAQFTTSILGFAVYASGCLLPFKDDKK